LRRDFEQTALVIYENYTAKTAMTPAQCRAARKLLDWSPADLARAAGVSVITVRNFEAGKVGGTRLALTLMKRALEGAGVRFSTAENDEGGGSVELGMRPR
jgi:DNA-binding transcriptional regulator YiaG